MKIDRETARPGAYRVEFVIEEVFDGQVTTLTQEVIVVILADQYVVQEEDDEPAVNEELGQILIERVEKGEEASDDELPTMDIESVSEDGVVTLSFSQELVELADLDMLNYTNLLVEIEAYDDDMTEYLQFNW